MSSYSKGRREEEALVRLLRRHGAPAERVPLSGAVDRRRADVVVGDLAISVKYGVEVPAALYRGSLLRMGRLYVLPLEAYLLDACRPAEGLPAVPPLRSVAAALRGCDLLVARAKGREWRVVGSKEALDALKEVIRAHKGKRAGTDGQGA